MTDKKDQVKKKKAKAAAPCVNVSVDQTECEPSDAVLTKEQIEAFVEKRVKRGLVLNKTKLETLISGDCLLQDFDTACAEIPAQNTAAPLSIAVLKATDINIDFFEQNKRHSQSDIESYMKGYEAGAAKAILEMGKISSSSELVEYAVAARKVIHLLLQKHKDRINFMEEVTPDELASRIAYYFDTCEKRKRSFTVPGLAFEIGFMQRQDLLDFVANNYKSLNGYMVARALMKIEDQRNTEIISGGGVMAGHKLDLATNFSWSDAGKKGETRQPGPTTNTVIHNTTNNLTITPESLPPTLTLDQWQSEFIVAEKRKNGEVVKLTKTGKIRKPMPKRKPKVIDVETT
jgi:hypothetical protein